MLMLSHAGRAKRRGSRCCVLGKNEQYDDQNKIQHLAPVEVETQHQSLLLEDAASTGKKDHSSPPPQQEPCS